MHVGAGAIKYQFARSSGAGQRVRQVALPQTGTPIISRLLLAAPLKKSAPLELVPALGPVQIKGSPLQTRHLPCKSLLKGGKADSAERCVLSSLESIVR